MENSETGKCELGLQGDEDGLVKREEQGLTFQTEAEPKPKGTGANTHVQPDRDRGVFVV